MTLSQRLSEFKFNLETMDLLTSMGRSSQQTLEEMLPLGFTSPQVNFMQSSRSLLNSVLLRLHLYSEQNLSEAKVRSSLGVLNNVNVNNLLDTVFFTSTTVAKPQNNITIPTTTTSTNVEVELEEDDDMPKSESSRFEQFFASCVKKTNDPTDIVKTSDFYSGFTDWWGGIYEEPVPDKNELKDFLNNKLGKSNKNTWSNVALC